MDFKGLFGAQFSIESCAKMPFITGRQAVHWNIFCRLGTICRSDSQNSLPVLFHRGGWVYRGSSISQWFMLEKSAGRGWLYNPKSHSENDFFPKYNFDYYCLWDLLFIFRSCICYSCYNFVHRQQKEMGTFAHLIPVYEFQRGLWCWGPICGIQDWRAHSFGTTLISDYGVLKICLDGNSRPYVVEFV